MIIDKLQQGGDDSISVTVNEDDVTQEQIEEYIGIINSELYQLDYEIRCSIDLDNMLVWQLVRINLFNRGKKLKF